jgi:hypothetical protein
MYCTVELHNSLPETMFPGLSGVQAEHGNHAETAQQMEIISPSKSDTVVLDLLSNVAFVRLDENVVPTPGVRTDDDSCHNVGRYLCPPPRTTLKKVLSSAAL